MKEHFKLKPFPVRAVIFYIKIILKIHVVVRDPDVNQLFFFFKVILIGFWIELGFQLIER